MDEQETIYPIGRQARVKSHSSELDEFGNQMSQGLKNSSVSSSPHKRIYRIEDIINQKTKKPGLSSSKNINLKILLTAIKDYKVEGPETGSIFYGFSKRSSQPVAIKYFDDKMDHVLEVYDRLWKNIAKA